MESQLAAAWRLRLAVNVRRTQRVALVRGAGLSSGAPVARHRVEHAADRAGRRDSEDPAPTPRLAWGDVKSRPFGESYRAVRWAGSRGYEPGSGRGRACMATLELRIL